MTASDFKRPTLREWLQKGGSFDCALNPNFLGAFAQLGCLGALQREGLLSDLCGLAGSSAGAMSGAAIASGLVVFDETSKDLALHANMDALVSLGDRRWQVLDPGLGLGFLKGRGVEATMTSLYLSKFEQTLIPFACTATHLFSTKTAILNSGSLPSAVRASMTVPILFQPARHENKRFLVDGGIWDCSGSIGLRGLPKQPERSLHIIVNRRMSPMLSHFERIVPPSKFGAPRSNIVTVRLNNPPTLLFGDESFRSFGRAIMLTGAAVLKALDRPMQPGDEDGHFIIDIDVAWPDEPCYKCCKRRHCD